MLVKLSGFCKIFKYTSTSAMRKQNITNFREMDKCAKKISCPCWSEITESELFSKEEQN